MNLTEHRLIYRRFNNPQRQNCNNEQMNVPKAVEKKGSGLTYEDLNKRSHEVISKQRALITKFQTNPHLFLNTWKKFTPEFNKANFQLDAIQKNRAQYAREYCGSHLDIESKAISQLEAIINKTMADATAIENPTKMESTTIRQSGRAEVVPGQEVTVTYIPLKNYADITFDFDPEGGATVLPSVIDGRERTGAQTFGDLEKDGYTVTRKKGSHIVEVKSKVGFTYSYDQVKITTVEKAKERATEEIKEDVSNARDAVKNFPKSPTEDPESYKIVEREVDETVATSADIGPEVADATQAAIITNQKGMLRPRREEINKQTGKTEQKLYDLNRIETNDNGHDKYKLQAANQAVEDLVKKVGLGKLQTDTSTLIEKMMDHQIELVKKTNNDPSAVASAIRTLDALQVLCDKEGQNKGKTDSRGNTVFLTDILQVERKRLENLLPQKAMASAHVFESYELMVQKLNTHRLNLVSKFDTTKDTTVGEDLAEAIQCQLFAMRQYNMNEKSVDDSKFPYTREKLVKQLHDVTSETHKIVDAQIRRLDSGPKI